MVSVSGHSYRKPASCSEARTVRVHGVLGPHHFIQMPISGFIGDLPLADNPCPRFHTTYSNVLRSHGQLPGSETPHPPIWSSAA